MSPTRTKLVLTLAAGLMFTLCSHVYAGSVAGTVKFDGTAPKFKEIKMDADPLCAAQHTTPVLPQTLVLGDGNTMGNVFVYVKSGLKSGTTPAPTSDVVIDQKGCQYHPHVAAVQVGQPVKILNPDGTLHNVHALSKVNPEFNAAMPKFRTEITRTFDKAEPMFAVKCDVHPWMGAWLAVMPNSFFAVTKEDGKFSIDNLPAGTYEIEAWHEKLGKKSATVKVGDSDTATADFTFAAPTKS
jgi:plastocyanin